VESGRADPVSGRAVPWPWTINAEGAGRYFETKEAAVAATRALLASGVRSVDVGCGQVNLMHHPAAFATLDAAFDPASNAGYAARFLRSLRGSTGSWPYAAAAYHSQTPELGHAYAQRVKAAWPDAAQHGPWPPPPTGAVASGSGAVAPRTDYSMFTASFAARVRRMDQDRARQLAELRALVATPGVRLPPAPTPLRGAAARDLLVPEPRARSLPRLAVETAPARTAGLTGRRGT
jgi:hypothetical protein